MTDNMIQAKGLVDFSKNLGKKRLDISKNMTKNVIKNLGWALEIGAFLGTVFASRSPEAASSSLPEVIIFYHTGKRLCLGKSV